MKKSEAFYVLMLVTGFFSCGGSNTSSNVEAPGGEQTAKDKVLTDD